MQPARESVTSSPTLIRGMGLGSATALNMIDMIGVGPFITMPLVVAAMGGPQALLGWLVGALLAVCDGLVSAELGAALPGSGGSYRYLSEIYGPQKWGRLISFLFIWQLSFSAPLSIASGCIGLAGYAAIIGRTWKPSTPRILLRFTFPGRDRCRSAGSLPRERPLRLPSAALRCCCFTGELR
jgi:APA family basic amino acid/polyamine antiporter